MSGVVKYTGAEKNMTFAELEKFVISARKAGAVEDANVSAQLSTSGKLKEIEVEIASD
ncbi:hypothetical protein [Kitasatospora sp. NPDC056181]|uniref:hypothetical protein n=1 Tax=Kitasatospora sp. NPDC056181 TaxID=3345737 RepID=UPI0035D5B5F0